MMPARRKALAYIDELKKELGIKDETTILFQELPCAVLIAHPNTIAVTHCNSINRYIIGFRRGLNNPMAYRMLAHEFIHISQFQQKRLAYSSDINIVLWDNKEINIRKLPYKQYPWEIEAFKYEFKLAKSILQIINKQI